MRTKALALFAGLAVAGLAMAPATDVTAQGKAKATKTAAKCELKRGRATFVTLVRGLSARTPIGAVAGAPAGAPPSPTRISPREG